MAGTPRRTRCQASRDEAVSVFHRVRGRQFRIRGPGGSPSQTASWLLEQKGFGRERTVSFLNRSNHRLLE